MDLEKKLPKEILKSFVEKIIISSKNHIEIVYKYKDETILENI